MGKAAVPELVACQFGLPSQMSPGGLPDVGQQRKAKPLRGRLDRALHRQPPPGSTEFAARGDKPISHALWAAVQRLQATTLAAESSALQMEKRTGHGPVLCPVGPYVRHC